VHGSLLQGSLQRWLSGKRCRLSDLAHCANKDQEAKTRTSDLSDHHPAIVSRVIFYLYTGDYDEHLIPKIFQDRCTEIELPADTMIQRKTRGGVQAQVQVQHETNSLKVNSMVYKLAEMLGMEDLQDIASARCQACLAGAYSYAGFSSVLKTLFESTREEDNLRVRAIIFLARKDKQGDLREDTIEVLKEYEPKLWEICHKVLEEYQDTEEDTYIARSEETVAKLEDLGLQCKHGKAVIFTTPEANEYYTLVEVRRAEKGVVVKFDCGRC
jgi:hypothetical protein